MIGSGRGGGGGFNGFPYRSSHQQGQDGPNRGRGRGRTGRPSHQRRRNGSANNSFQAQLDVPVQQRRLLVGRGGGTLNWLKEVSQANIFVPQQHNRRQNQRQSQEVSDNDVNAVEDVSQQQPYPVRVNSSNLASLLHAFYAIVHLLSESSDFSADFIGCTVQMRTNNNDNTKNNNVEGKLFLSRNTNDSNWLLFSGIVDTSSQYQFQVYCVELITLEEDGVATIVDNVRFVHSSVERCRWIYREAPRRRNNNDDVNSLENQEDNNVGRLIFIYGSDEENTATLFYEEVCKAINAS